MTTTVYHKRDDAKYALCPMTPFPHIDSFLSIGSKYNIIYSQMTRYTRICNTFKGFKCQTGKLIATFISKGYNPRTLRTKVSTFLNRNLPLYNHDDRTFVMNGICHSIAYQLQQGMTKAQQRRHNMRNDRLQEINQRRQLDQRIHDFLHTIRQQVQQLH